MVIIIDVYVALNEKKNYRTKLILFDYKDYDLWIS